MIGGVLQSRPPRGVVCLAEWPSRFPIMPPDDEALESFPRCGDIVGPFLKAFPTAIISTHYQEDWAENDNVKGKHGAK